MTQHLRTNDWCTRFQCEYVAHKRFHITLPNDHIGNLYDWIVIGFGENASSSSTFNVKTQNAKRCHFGPFSFRFMCNERIECHINFNLTPWLNARRSKSRALCICTGGQFNPTTADNASVNHETNIEINIRFVRTTILKIKFLANDCALE